MPADVIVAVSDNDSNGALLYKGNTFCCVEGYWMPADVIVAVSDNDSNGALLYKGNTFCCVEGC